MKNLLFIIIFFCNKSIAQKGCDASQLPIIFVHGFMGSGDNWATQVQRFSSNGFCEDRMFVFDWNSFGKQNTSLLLNNFVDSILKITRAKKINLVGHSAGGGVCYSFLNDSLHALKVAHYVHVGSFPMKGPAGKNGEVPTMNIYSGDDQVLKNGKDILHAINIRQKGNDHLQTATSAASFLVMYQFFLGLDGKVNTNIQPSKSFYKDVYVKGVTLGENKPLINDSVRVFLVDPKTGQRRKNYVPWTTFDKDSALHFRLEKDSYTEFEVRPKQGRAIHYFFEPQVRDNRNIYLRALPTEGLAAAMLGKIPEDDNQTALVIFSANNAVIAGRDSLAIDSIPLSLPSIMPAAKTSIACFVFDDGDGISSGKALKSMAAAPFMSGVDVFIKADEKKAMKIYYNGRLRMVPKIKSKDGIVIVVFN